MDVFQSEQREGLDDRKAIAQQIDHQEKILSNARKRFMTEEIDGEDFKAIKAECNEDLRKVEEKLANLPNKAESLKTVEGLLDIVIQKYTNIQLHYKTANIAEKRKLIGSMYPKNLCFDVIGHRTPYLNEPLSLIMQINRQLHCIKKGEKLSFDNLSPQVALKGIEHQ
jgi:site-specific DNA recombinase